MDRYIGLDVHVESTTCVVLEANGKRLKTEVVPTTAPALIRFVRSLGGQLHVVTEEGQQSTWVYETLQPHVAEMVVAMPRRREGAKNDARDALALAEELRRGTLERIVYKRQGPFARLRECVRAHRMISRDLLRVKNRLKAICRSRGVQVSGEAIYHPETREEYLAQLPSQTRELAEMVATELDTVMELHRQSETRLREEAAHHSVIDRLATIPCIGTIRAAYIVAVVVTPHRFRSKRQFWAYCGFAVVTHSSADWTQRSDGRWARSRTVKTRGLNPNRNPLLKEVFKSAALNVANMRDEHPLKQDYLQLLAAGMKPPIARVTMARRLAATALAIWKNEEVYDLRKRYQPPKAA
jgi:transposase